LPVLKTRRPQAGAWVRELALPPTSRATWAIEAGANPKDVQAMMRHSRVGTTLDIYAQFVPDSQRRAIEQTSKMAAERIANAQAAKNANARESSTMVVN